MLLRRKPLRRRLNGDDGLEALAKLWLPGGEKRDDFLGMENDQG